LLLIQLNYPFCLLMTGIESVFVNGFIAVY
jgi:hypothetical protein